MFSFHDISGVDSLGLWLLYVVVVQADKIIRSLSAVCFDVLSCLCIPVWHAGSPLYCGVFTQRDGWLALRVF